MTFYLQQHEKGGRWLIDSTFPLDAYKVAESVDASCWLEAKERLKFDLSPVQEWLLEKFKKSQLQAA